MSYRIRPIFILISLVLFLFSCKKDDESPEENNLPNGQDNFGFQSGVLVQTTIVGFARGLDGQGLEGVEVSSGASSSISGSNGYFFLENVLADSYRMHITAQYEGYHFASRVLRPHENDLSYVEISMIPLSIVGSLMTEFGGTVSLSNGTSVSLGPNSVETATGEAYMGVVNVALHYLDITEESIYSVMPGDLTALRSDDQFGILESYGMAAIMLLSPSGEELQVAQGMLAEIILKVPETLLSEASPTIPLWYFDEQVGVWKEEGEAILENGSYRGDVSHFSFWNADAFQDGIFLSGRVLDNDLQPIAFRVVTIDLSSSTRPIGRDYTDQNGFFGGLVPRDRSMQISIRGKCTFESAYSDFIGPFDNDHGLGDIILDEGQDDGLLVEGQLQLCEGEDIEYVAAYLESDNGLEIRSITPDASGYFSEQMKCNGHYLWFYIKTTDNVYLPDFGVSEGQSNIDIGLLDYCMLEGSEFFQIDLDGQNFNMITVDHVTQTGPEQLVNGEFALGGEDYHVEMTYAGSSFIPGGYLTDQDNTFELTILNSNLSTPISAYSINNAETISFNITQVASGIGEYTEGTFSGTVFVSELDSDQPTTFPNVPISGSFKVEREF